jgi:hypothetical protein
VIQKLAQASLMMIMIFVISTAFAMEQQNKAADFIENAKQRRPIDKTETRVMATAGCANMLWALGWVNMKHTDNPGTWETVYELTGLGLVISSIVILGYYGKKLYDTYDPRADSDSSLGR